SSIGSGNADAALAFMDANMLGNAANQQAWKNNFSTIASLTVVSIEEYSKPEWTDVSQMFKVQLAVHLKPGSASLGWLEGNNTRWISLKAENGQWRIHELANNP
ncbi:MAG: hypothetical protein NTV45_05090, partial [Firmicutes bacterium]|nr:hypothetical protein [Bacillota bacterium]